MFCVRAGATAALCLSSFVVTGVFAAQPASILTSIPNQRAAPNYAFGVDILSAKQPNSFVQEFPELLAAATFQPVASQWSEARYMIDTYLAMNRDQVQEGLTAVSTTPAMTTETLLAASTRGRR
jgi:hypothetical protein